jgi:hypothetical protein
LHFRVRCRIQTIFRGTFPGEDIKELHGTCMSDV